MSKQRKVPRSKRIRVQSLPRWAPQALVDDELPRQMENVEEEAKRSQEERQWWIEFGGISDSESLDLLRKLITRPEMEEVWRRLDKREGKFRQDPHTWVCEELRAEWQKTHYSCAVYHACIAAVAQWRMCPKLTRAEHRQYHLRVAKLVKKLIEVLRAPSGAIHLEWNAYMSDLTDLVSRLKIRTDIPGGPHLPPDVLPPIDRLLERMEQNASRWAEAAAGIVAQPNSSEAAVRFAAFWLSDFFERCYGQRLHPIVATLTNVIMDSDITEDHVRGWLRTRGRRESKLV